MSYFLDAKVAAGFMLLSHLVPPKKLRKYGGRCYKPSIANAKSSLIKQASVSVKILINIRIYVYMQSGPHTSL